MIFALLWVLDCEADPVKCLQAGSWQFPLESVES